LGQEEKDEKFFEDARTGFLLTSKLKVFNGRWVTIDASGTEDQVFERIQSAIMSGIMKKLHGGVRE